MNWEENCLKALELAFDEKKLLDPLKQQNFEEAINLFEDSIKLNPNRAWPYLKFADMKEKDEDKISLYIKSLIAEDNSYAKQHIKNILKKYFTNKDIIDNCIIINGLVVIANDDFLRERLINIMPSLGWIKDRFIKDILKVLIVGKEEKFIPFAGDVYYWFGEDVNFGFKKLKIKPQEKSKVIRLGYIGQITEDSNIDKLINAVIKINQEEKKYSLNILTKKYINEYQSLYNKLKNIKIEEKDYKEEDLIQYYSNIDCYVSVCEETIHCEHPYESIYLEIPSILSDIKAHKKIKKYCCMASGKYGVTEQSLTRCLKEFHQNYNKYKEMAKMGSSDLLTFYSWKGGLEKVLFEIY